ncbi:MAG TPA: hypothetical protein VFA75_15865 [Nevskia sp.]|nr:hypothetical protein [Nevskia sp.]
MNRHPIPYVLLPLLFAIGPALAAAGSSSGSDARSLSPTSPNPRTSAPATVDQPVGHDLNPAPPTQAECERLAKEQSSLNSGGEENADIKAKIEQCRKRRDNPPQTR